MKILFLVFIICFFFSFLFRTELAEPEPFS